MKEELQVDKKDADESTRVNMDYDYIFGTDKYIFSFKGWLYFF